MKKPQTEEQYQQAICGRIPRLLQALAGLDRYQKAAALKAVFEVVRRQDLSSGSLS